VQEKDFHMVRPTIYLSQADVEKIHRLIGEVVRAGNRSMSNIQQLEGELERALVVEPHKVPPDRITMRSQALLKDQETGETMTYTLVFPEDADIDQGKISVLAPIGTAMLGCRVGDLIDWETPGGTRSIRVEKLLYQPEAAGDYS
jgi:regulator of nucleoside diphosphate kinase